MKVHVLIVANRTAASPELLSHLRERYEPDAAHFELLVPPTAAGPAGEAQARTSVEAAQAAFAEAGLDVEGRIGSDTDPVVAAAEAYDPARHDEIVVSTLPPGASHWLGLDGPARMRRVTGALVHHVVARPPAPEPARAARPSAPAEERPSAGLLTPLMALGYGGPHDD